MNKIQYKKSIESVIVQALSEANLDEGGSKRLLAHSEEFQAYVTAGVRQFSAVAPKHGELARVPDLFYGWQPPLTPSWNMDES